jgi:hypothetical protein
MPDRKFIFLFVLIAAACAKNESAPPPAASAPATTSSATVSAAPATATTTTTVTPAAAPAAPAVSGAIATADGDTAGITAAIKELKRSTDGTLSLKFVITNGSSKRLGFGYDFGDPDHHIRDFSSVGGVQMIDPAGKKKYFVARDAEGKCVCSTDMKDVEPGASVNAWAKFPAPPDDVKKISVVIPHFSPMDDVPISQ